MKKYQLSDYHQKALNDYGLDDTWPDGVLINAKKIEDQFLDDKHRLEDFPFVTIDAIRSVLMIMMSITQVDIALWGVICAVGTSLFTIRMLLNDKEFKPTQDHVILQDDEEQNL